MSIDIPYTACEQCVTFDECQDLRIGRDLGLWQIQQRREHGFTRTYVPQRKFTNDKRMRENRSDS